MINITAKLGGFSGCSVLKVNDPSGVPFVVKKSSSVEYNQRLQASIDKQKLFNSINSSKCLKAPLIYRTYLDEKSLLTCEMEFIDENILADSDIVFDAVTDFLLMAKTSPAFVDSSSGEFYQAVNGKILNIMPCLLNPLVDVVSQALQVIDSDAFNVPKSFCHGDFNLENILLSTDNCVYLIDFLDCFYPSVYLDIAKFYQVIEADWLNIKQGRKPRSLIPKTVRLKKRLDSFIRSEFYNYTFIHYFLLSLNLLRIIPYSKTESVKSLLEEQSLKYLICFLEGKSL